MTCTAAGAGFQGPSQDPFKRSAVYQYFSPRTVQGEPDLIYGKFFIDLFHLKGYGKFAQKAVLRMHEE